MNAEQRTTALKAKLVAREGQPGFAANAEAIRQQIAGLESGFRHKETGLFVSFEEATANPESVEPV